MIVNSVCLLLSIKLGASFVKSFSSRFFNLALNYDIMDDFYGILLIVLSIAMILQVTMTIHYNELKFDTSMISLAMVLFGMSTVFLILLVLLYM